jgi:hypothetical protein
MRVSSVIPFLLSAGLISAACGSDEEPESSGSKGGAGAGGTTAGTGGTGGSGGSTGGSSGSGGTGGGGSGTGGTAGTTAGAGGEINDGSAGTPADGGAGAPNAEVHCGTQMAPATCTGGQVCCYVQPGADYCSAANACECLDGGQCIRLAIPCDGPEDCSSGQVCCGTVSEGGFGYARVSCQATCSTASGEYEFCHGGDAGTACREAGTTCRASLFVQGFQTCQPAG